MDVDRTIERLLTPTFDLEFTDETRTALVLALQALKVRYKLFFCPEDTHALGGLNEFVASHPTLDEAVRDAQARLLAWPAGWARVLDAVTDLEVWSNDGSHDPPRPAWSPFDRGFAIKSI
jgi:hypothetical protein